VETDPEAGRSISAIGATPLQHYHAWLQNRTARPLLASELTPNVLAAVA
jgi:hypothetical protein